MHRIELEQLRRAFHYFDKNSDGTIDLEELRASLQTLGNLPSSAELAAILADMDSDGSGGIEFDEFLQVIQKQKAQQVARGNEADTVEAFVAMGGKPDKSGEVDLQRLQRTLAEFELRVDLGRLLEEMDKDADGTVTYEEFKSLLGGV